MAVQACGSARTHGSPLRLDQMYEGTRNTGLELGLSTFF